MVEDPRQWTILVMVVTCLWIIGWDIYVAFFNQVPNRQDTISGILLSWAERVWALPYAAGVLMGHLFCPALGGPVLGSVWSTLLLLLTGLLVAGVGRKFRQLNIGWTWQGPVLVCLGVFAGHFLWPQ